MDDVTIHAVGNLEESIYVRPMQVVFTQKGGKKRKWDYIRVHDSVAILIHNTTSKCLVLVRQFRPAVYMHECHKRHENLSTTKASRTVIEVAKDVPSKHGFLYELCAGIVDKAGKTMEEIASMEVLEETGYRVSPEKFQLISKYRSGVGTHGSVQTLFYVEVTDDMKVEQGGGLESEGEMIEEFQLPVEDIRNFMNDNESLNRPAGVMYALMWFVANIYPKHYSQTTSN